MGLIIRTAGAERTKAEIKRDYDYLLRLWNEIRETDAARRSRPALIYEEGDLIKRALRDLYTRDIEEVLVDGEEATRRPSDFMTHADAEPREERDALRRADRRCSAATRSRSSSTRCYSPVVQLRPAARSSSHHRGADRDRRQLRPLDPRAPQEETALKTNLEAADEVARQLRLRDLAGLIVVDFIDMAEQRNQRAVEKRLRDALKLDRARIQIGKISQFGLLELSRQRLRAEPARALEPGLPGTAPAPAWSARPRAARSRPCARSRPKASAARPARLRVELPTEVALYLLNHKRDGLSRLEDRYAMRVQIGVEPSLHSGQIGSTCSSAASARSRGPSRRRPPRPRSRRPPSPSGASVRNGRSARSGTSARNARSARNGRRHPSAPSASVPRPPRRPPPRARTRADGVAAAAVAAVGAGRRTASARPSRPRPSSARPKPRTTRRVRRTRARRGRTSPSAGPTRRSCRSRPSPSSRRPSTPRPRWPRPRPSPLSPHPPR